MLRRSLLLVALVIGLVIAPSTAFADSVSMHFIGPGGNNAGGVYTYPYNFSINGAPTVSLICDTYSNTIVSGETWTANVSSLLSGNGLFGSALIDYKAAALIFQSVLNGTLNANVANWAIWGLFDSSATKNSYFKNSGAANVELQYLALAANAPNGAFNGFVIYTPIPGTQSWGGTPQEFIGYNPRAVVPEPASLTLLGTGLLGLAQTLRKKARG
jgi:hypothetical protein